MIRNILFNTFFFFGIFLISMIFIPTLIMPSKIILFGGKIMGYWSGICLKLFLSTEIIIKGRDKIVKEEKIFIAATHQSMFETFYLQTIFNSPIFILKNELIRVPIFGWYLKKIGSISVNRNKISKQNLGLIDKIKASIKKTSRPIIIFPQATRVLPSERVPFKKGVGRIYEAIKLPCVPVALNTGKVWPKNSFNKYPGNIVVSFLNPIEPGLEKERFVEKLQENIYKEIDLIN